MTVKLENSNIKQDGRNCLKQTYKGGRLSSFVPIHLRKYIVPQNYKKYSPEDQAVWRFIMKGIVRNLSRYGYHGSLEGLQKTGIYPDKIPKITNIDKNLQNFGWRAVCISGFIPPRAFMEFHLHKILPIASELRTVQHIFYTPAPDIVHEAVGHVPFLTNSVFSKFLSAYAKTVLKSISSSEDMEKYKAIRDLSDLKENPKSTLLQIKKQEQKLKSIIKNISHVSEASYLSRLIWWTSEYGLMGSLKNPKIYGAGLISSIGETLHIQKVKKIKLSEDCINYPFDITDFQPQLFVARNFEHLLEVLQKVSKRLAIYRGGVYAVNQALQSKTLNTVVLDSGLQISGMLTQALQTKSKELSFLKFTGPVQLAFKDKQLANHGKDYHKEGYSSPLNFLTKNKKPFHLWTKRDLSKESLKIGSPAQMKFKGGIQLKGQLERELKQKGQLIVLTFKNCLITDSKNNLLYHPSWGIFDLAVGKKVTSVFSGPADSPAYQLKDDFEPSKAPQKTITAKQKKIFSLYKKTAQINSSRQLKHFLTKIKKQKHPWLLFLETLNAVKEKEELKKQVLSHLGPVKSFKLQKKKVFKLGRTFYNI
ncbi:MAG: aromatic amino acid hydroxylase [Oligoflexia bacterium]|nr:aromatic amino acid hydroxylase [Oligoflexia bacterium]